MQNKLLRKKKNIRFFKIIFYTKLWISFLIAEILLIDIIVFFYF